MVAAPGKPLGRTTLRKSLPGDGQPRRVKLWTQDAAPGTTAEKLLKAYLGSFEAIDALDARKAVVAADLMLTDAGKQNAIRESLFRDAVPAFYKGRLELAKARREVETRRAALAPPKADPADAAGAVRRQELRSYMRGLADDKAREAFIRKSARDAEVAQAVIEQPAALSGIRESLRDQILNEAMESKYSDQLAEIASLEEAIDVTASAIEAGRAEVHTEAAAIDPALRDPDRFNAVAAGIEAKTPALWIKPHRENGAEVMRWLDWDEATKTGSWRIAEQDHLDRGIVAATRAEFDKLAGASVVDLAADTPAEARRKRAEFVDQHGHEAYLNRNNGEVAA